MPPIGNTQPGALFCRSSRYQLSNSSPTDAGAAAARRPRRWRRSPGLTPAALRGRIRRTLAPGADAACRPAPPTSWWRKVTASTPTPGLTQPRVRKAATQATSATLTTSNRGAGPGTRLATTTRRGLTLPRRRSRGWFDQLTMSGRGGFETRPDTFGNGRLLDSRPVSSTG